MIGFKKIILLLSILPYMTRGLTGVTSKNHDTHNYFVVELNTTYSNEALSKFIEKYSGDYQFESHVKGLDGHYVFSIKKEHPHNEFLGNLNSDNEDLLKRIENYEMHYDDIISNSDLKAIHILKPKMLQKRMPVPIDIKLKSEREDDTTASKASKEASLNEVIDKLDIKDPIFKEQWHLVNTQYPGNDVNVTGLWYEGITGQGIVSAIVDDGLDCESDDLKDNFNSEGSWDYNDNTNLPLPRLYDDYHGTRCAGEIAAVKNDKCGVGVAYGSQVSGIRILSGAITAQEEAEAMIYQMGINDIYSCSWGPTDDGKTLSAPDVLVKKAMIQGVQAGRKNKGSVYVFASGNGARYHDSCNFDGYTNSIYSITVSAIDHKGVHPDYAEACSAVMVVTYSSGSGEHIHTTDFHKGCSSTHGGTSAAAPLAAGIYSLILHSNPNLTWRDVQYISALSTVPVNLEDGDYQDTALGRKYSHKYGYGKMDAYAMAYFAKNWKNVKPQSWYYSDVQRIDESITIKSGTDSPIIKRSITVTEADLKAINLETVEHVTVTVNIEASYRGAVGVKLTSPFGVVSELATYRPFDSSTQGFKAWTFMSVAHWGENGLGDWNIEVYGDSARDSIIRLVDWQLRFFGESIDEEKAEVYDISKDYAAVRRDRLTQPGTTSAVPSSVSTDFFVKSSTAPQDEGKEADPATKSSASTSTSAAAETLHTSEATATDADDGEEEGKNKQYLSDHTGQYFMAIAVVGFILVILVMKAHKNSNNTRRRRRREEYEFDIIPGEDYSDSDDNEDDSLDLGRHGNNMSTVDDLYYEFNAETVPDYDDAMFSIVDEDDEHREDETKPSKSSIKEQTPESTTESPVSEESSAPPDNEDASEDAPLVGKSAKNV